MSAKKRPYDALIRQLYVDERKSIDDVQHIVNREFGLTKEKRYYKHCIKRLNIKRNVNAKDKQKVVRVVKFLRCTSGNLESRFQVRVRGHNLTPRLSRWLKDDRKIPQPISPSPPSPLPSYISVSLRQSPESASPVLSEGHIRESESVTRAEWKRGVIQRLNKYAGYENSKLNPQESRAVLEDLQIILSCDNALAVENSCSYEWDTIVDEYTIKVNEIIAGSIIDEKWTVAIIDQHPLKTRDQLQMGRRVSAAQRTRHGFVEFTYWIGPRGSHLDFAIERTDTSRLDLARLSIVPRETAKFRIVIDMTLCPNLPARIAYQPMIRNDSEVFDIAKSGQVEALQRAIGKGTASLEDRDEQGRPLLYYAAWNSRVELCRYLIAHGADVNELVEVERFVRPMYSLTLPLFISRANDEYYQMCHCFKIMMEGGADLSLKAGAYHSRHTIFYLGMLCAPFESFQHMINLGQQFICPKDSFEVLDGKKRYPLHLLAEQCGYGLIFESVDITEKAILLLESGANISYPDYDGCTVLHTILGSVRYHQYGSKRQARRLGRVRQWTRSFHEPKEFLIAFIAAGGDVYAINDEGSTPSMHARWFGREKEWLEVLESTGYAPEEVIAHSDPKSHDCSRERQESRLSLKEYRLRRKQELIVKNYDIIDESEDVNDEMERSDDGSYLSDTDAGGDEETDKDGPEQRCQRCSMRLDDDGISNHYQNLLMEVGNDIDMGMRMAR